jgi:hypothetical protein
MSSTFGRGCHGETTILSLFDLVFVATSSHTHRILLRNSTKPQRQRAELLDFEAVSTFVPSHGEPWFARGWLSECSSARAAFRSTNQVHRIKQPTEGHDSAC